MFMKYFFALALLTGARTSFASLKPIPAERLSTYASLVGEQIKESRYWMCNGKLITVYETLYTALSWNLEHVELIDKAQEGFVSDSQPLLIFNLYLYNGTSLVRHEIRTDASRQKVIGFEVKNYTLHTVNAGDLASPKLEERWTQDTQLVCTVASKP